MIQTTRNIFTITKCFELNFKRLHFASYYEKWYGALYNMDWYNLQMWHTLQKIAHCGFGWKIGILSYKVFYVYGFTHKKSKRWIETDTNETVRLYRKEKKEDYLKCESDIRKSIKTFPFTLLYPLFVVTKEAAVCLIPI